MCRFKTLPCVPAKRAHVEHMRAFCWYTRKRFEPTHGDVLNLHTEGFSACQAAPHTDNTQTPLTTHTSLSAETHARENPLVKTKSPSVENDAESDPCQSEKMLCRKQKKSTIPNQQEITLCSPLSQRIRIVTYADEISLLFAPGDLVGHNILNLENESRKYHWNSFSSNKIDARTC